MSMPALPAPLLSSILAMLPVATQGTRTDAKPESEWLKEFRAQAELERQFVDEVHRRQEAIRAELAAWTAPAWAGEYYTIAGGASLQIAPGNGLAWEEIGCFHYEANFGDILEVDGHSALVDLARKPSYLLGGKEPDSNSTPRMRFFFIPWGEALFLVPETWMVRFCNDINAGRPADARARSQAEHLGIGYLLRQADRERIQQSPDRVPLSALHMPSAWQKWVLDEPIVASVVESEKAQRIGPPYEGSDEIVFEQRSRISAGSDQGLKVGMFVYRRESAERVEVVEVGPAHAWLRFTFFFPRDEYPRLLRVGDRVSTRRCAGT